MEAKNSSYIDNHKSQIKMKFNIKPIHFLIIFVAISTILAFILGGFFIGRDKAEKNQEQSTEITEQVKLDIKEIPNNPDSWKEYQLSNVGLSMQLPETLVEKGDWNEIELVDNGGQYLCFSYDELTKNDACETEDLIITSVSSNYTDSSNFFFSSKGVEISNGANLLINSNSEQVSLQNEKTKPLENEYGINILKILGNDTNTSPDKEYLGAVVNTGNDNYPALIIQMEINGDVSEYEFDQILESIKPIN